MDAYEAEREALLRAFGEQLRALREHTIGTQEELAFAARLHRTHISLLERGKREPSLSTLLKLLRRRTAACFARVSGDGWLGSLKRSTLVRSGR